MQTDASDPAFTGLDDRVFMTVIDQGNLGQRIELARQLSQFLGRADAPPKEREQVVPAVLMLAADPDAEVRQALAEGLADQPDLDADVLFAIIADDDEIALPFLTRTPALGHWHMLAVLRVGDDARRATIALRPDVSAEAIDYIVESLPLPVNALLLENAAAVLTRAQFQRLHQRFAEAPEIMEALLARDDLPLEIRIAETRRRAARMQQLVVARGWLPANDAGELIADAEETAVLGLLTGAEQADLPAVISALVEDEMLTPSIIVRAACQGAIEVVALILADLAGVSPKRARDAMLVKPAGAFRSLHAKAGLPQGCYWTLQAACDVAREEREDGVTLTPDDFGRRLIEVLMTRYEALPMRERPGQLDYVGRFAADRVRLIARRLKADLLRAA